MWGALQSSAPQEECPQGAPTLSPGCPQGVPRKSPPLAGPVLPESSPEGHGVPADPPPQGEKGVQASRRALHPRHQTFLRAHLLPPSPVPRPVFGAAPPTRYPWGGQRLPVPPSPLVPGDRRLPLSPGPSRVPRSGGSRCRGVSPARGGERASGGGGGAGAGAGRGERSRPAPRYK